MPITALAVAVVSAAFSRSFATPVSAPKVFPPVGTSPAPAVLGLVPQLQPSSPPTPGLQPSIPHGFLSPTVPIITPPRPNGRGPVTTLTPPLDHAKQIPLYAPLASLTLHNKRAARIHLHDNKWPLAFACMLGPYRWVPFVAFAGLCSCLSCLLLFATEVLRARRRRARHVLAARGTNLLGAESLLDPAQPQRRDSASYTSPSTRTYRPGVLGHASLALPPTVPVPDPGTYTRQWSTGRSQPKAYTSLLGPPFSVAAEAPPSPTGSLPSQSGPQHHILGVSQGQANTECAASNSGCLPLASPTLTGALNSTVPATLPEAYDMSNINNSPPLLGLGGVVTASHTDTVQAELSFGDHGAHLSYTHTEHTELDISPVHQHQGSTGCGKLGPSAEL
eukprot:gene286-2392_t